MASIQYEIFGIHKTSNGRQCPEHEVCGKKLKVGDAIHLRELTVDIAGKSELAIGAFSVVDERECCVGFLPRFLIPHKAKYLGINRVYQTTK